MKLCYSITDGSSNAISESQRICGSQRCLQHSLQFLLKHLCASDGPIATSLACCKFFSRITSISQKLLQAIGNINCGVLSRWNSYLNSAEKVLQARSKIDSYTNSAECGGGKAVNIRMRSDYLDRWGYRTLLDVLILIKPWWTWL